MKEITAILILLSLLTSCGDQRKTAENTESINSAAETSTVGEISCEVTTTCSDIIFPIITTAEIPEESPKTAESQTTVTVSENAEEKGADDSVTTAKTPEIPPKTTESQTTVTVSEITKEKEPVDSVTTAVQTETEVAENPDMPQKTDYEKAFEIYNFMRENGSGTCVNYACQTYEMCREAGLSCYIVWTDAKMYGHTANTVQIGGIWYILDTQGGYFLDYNYGFTEVVDIDGNHVADGDMLSNYSYDELN